MRSLLEFLLLFGLSTVISGSDQILDTNIGRLRGKIETVEFNRTTKQVVKFLGIPFAEPPVGQLRFRKPVPKARLVGEYNATYMRPACLQEQSSNYTIATSEDCLYLNVFVPYDAINPLAAVSNPPRPVMVWVYGGGYNIGAIQFYDGGILSAFHDVIVVAVAYRVNIFGFLSTHDSASPGNYGLWDQHLGIKWTHDNIRAFNGDSNRVTIFGESAGSGSVFQQALYTGNNGLFQNVIGESGAPLAPWAFSEPGGYMDRYARVVASAVGCNGTWSQALVDCFRSKPGQNIIDKMSEIDVDLDPYKVVENQFSPVLDGEFFKIPPVKIFQNTHVQAQKHREFYRSLNILTGVNSQDGALFLGRLPFFGDQDLHEGISRDIFENKEIPLVVRSLFGLNNTALEKAIIQQYTDWSYPENKKSTLQNFINFETDYEFLVPAVRALNEHAILNSAASTYFYVFSHKPSTTNATYMTGANHAEELPFVFGVPPFVYNLAFGPSAYVPAAEITLSQLMMTMWSNFAKSGDPNKPVSLNSFFPGTWPKYDVTFQSYLDINTNMTLNSVKQRYASDRVAFWERLVPAILKAIKEAGKSSSDMNISGMFVG